jgi:hypothetical protein
MRDQHTVVSVPPRQILAEMRSALARLQALPQDGPAAAPEAQAGEGLLLPFWMIPHILVQPQFTVELLEDLRRADFPQEVYRRSAHIDIDRGADRVLSALQGRDPRNVEENRRIIGDVLTGLGIFAGLAMLAALSIALIFLKLGPVGVVFGIITLVLGFIVLLATALIMVVIAAVMALLGRTVAAVESFPLPDEAAAAAGG